MSVVATSLGERIWRVFAGENLVLAGLAVGLVGVGVAATLIAGFVIDGAGSIATAVAFGVFPAVGGIACGWYGLGVAGAAGVGVSPGVVIYVLQLLTQPEGDLSPIGFTVMLTSVSVPIAVAGFAAGTVVALLFR